MQYSDENRYKIPVLTRIAAWWILAACLIELFGIPIAWQKWHLHSRLAGDYLIWVYALLFCWLVSLFLLISVVALLVTRRKIQVVAAWTITTLLLLIQLFITPIEGAAFEDHIYFWNGWSLFIFRSIPLMMYITPLFLMFIYFGSLFLKKMKVLR